MISIDNIKDNIQVFKNFGLFYSRVIDTSIFKLSKKDKRRLREFFDSIDINHINSSSLSDELKNVLDSFDYEAARKNKSKYKLKKLKEKNRKIPSDAKSYWKPDKPSEVRDKSYYTNLRKTLCDSVDESDLRHLPRLGLGIEPRISIPRVKSDEVVIDKYTETKVNVVTKHHLYTPGWSSKGHFIDSDEETS
ncbi:hypothetical protein [Vibrio metschnikovii]|uniref:hypothetical protein n=1 Tax=Vibrio metschnikovii TaxID=28172 RepID=UPI001643FDDB|nr:hypothetical protein [Vibrio metschnikovii]MBC3622017.1 hypothetical protein [Vibrio metschnikovii]